MTLKDYTDTEVSMMAECLANGIDVIIFISKKKSGKNENSQVHDSFGESKQA